MPRSVIEGTQANPITITPADLPAEADFSFLRDTILTGNWAGRSLRYLDIRQSRCDADLSQCDITGIDSERTPWEGATLSEEQELTNACSFDFRHNITSALLRAYQGWSVTPEQLETMIDLLRRDENRNNPTVRTLLQIGADSLGLSFAEFRQHFLNSYASKMHLLKRMSEGTAGPDPGSPAAPAFRIWRLNPDGPDYTDIPQAQFTQPMLDAIARHDRWQLARAAEAAFDSIPLIVLCRRIRPEFDLIGTPRALFDDPELYNMSIDGDTPAARLRTTMLEGIPFGPRDC